MTRKTSFGFSLLEVLIVMGILAILSAVGAGFYRGFSKGVEINMASKNIVSELRGARAKSMQGEGDLKWGVHFVNGTDDYFEVFSTPTDYTSPSKIVTATTTLPGTITFKTPTEGISMDIIFDKLYGSTTPAIIEITTEGVVATTTITSTGNIY